MTNIQTPYFISNNESDEYSLMTVQELAEYLGIGRNRAYELLNTKTIKGFRIGNTWKVSKLAVQKYIYEQSGLV